MRSLATPWCPGMADELTMQVAQVVPCTEAEGPGKRFAIWFQGCPLRCPGCCNPEYLPFRGGETKTLAEMTRWLRDGDVTYHQTVLDGIERVPEALLSLLSSGAPITGKAVVRP